MCGFNLQNTHLGVLEQEKFLAVVVECDLGLEVGSVTGDLKDLALAEAVVLDPLADLEIGHRGWNEIGVGNLRGQRTVSQGLDLGGGVGQPWSGGWLTLVPDAAGRTVGIAAAHSVLVCGTVSTSEPARGTVAISTRRASGTV